MPPPLPDASKPDRRRSSSQARVCVVINQLACPGLGTLMWGRRVGYPQLAVMLAGFVLSMIFFGTLFAAVFQLMSNPLWNEADYENLLARAKPTGWLGFALCASAWLWSGWSSLAIWKEGRAASTPPPLP